MGVSSNVRKLLFPKDICLSVSSNEGLPMSLIEAASKACIIISTDVGGCNKVCIHEANGDLLPYPFITEEVLYKIKKLIENEDKLIELSKNSLEIFNQNFSEQQALEFWNNEAGIFSRD